LLSEKLFTQARTFKIDDSFAWELRRFTVWSCITGAFLGVISRSYSMYESSEGRVKFVYMGHIHIIEIVNEIE